MNTDYIRQGRYSPTLLHNEWSSAGCSPVHTPKHHGYASATHRPSDELFYSETDTEDTPTHSSQRSSMDRTNSFECLHPRCMFPFPMDESHHTSYDSGDNYHASSLEVRSTPSPIQGSSNGNQGGGQVAFKCRQLPCRTFISTGSCPYGDRCVFLHDPSIVSKPVYIKSKVFALVSAFN